jgi:hypothetical protein
MIKFFRSIRQQLLAENKTGKYLKYAIGEIVLVVIGILIALSINNWNEERKVIIKEKNYVRSIYQDLKRDFSNIEKNLDKLSFQYNTAVKVLNALDFQRVKVLDSVALVTKIGWDLSQIIPIERTENTWDVFKIQGEETYIIKDSLKVLLNNFYSSFDAQIERFNQLPKKVRQELRELTGNCHDGNSVKTIFENGIGSYGASSPQLRFCVLSNKKTPKLIGAIGVSCVVNMRLNKELLNKIVRILEYMEHEFSFPLNET